MVKLEDFEGVTIGRLRARFLTTSLPYCLYFVDGLLIDTGPHSLRRELEPLLAGLPIEQVALTHIHEDHCGLAAFLAARGVPVRCLVRVCGGSRARAPPPPLPPPRLGRRPAFPASPLSETVLTPHYEFRVVKAPGHTPRHVLFHEASRGWLFTGDFFLTARPRIVFCEEDLTATLDTLKRLERLEVRVLFDAHAGPLPNGARLLALKRAYLEELGGRVADLRVQGLDDRAIDRRLFPRRPLISRFSMGEWASLHMVRTAPVPESPSDKPE